MDARTAHRQAIVVAMAALLKSRTFDKLTVASICAQAGVSRQTFYRCFEDKYAAAWWYVDGIVAATCRRIGTTLGWRTGYLSFFKVVERNPRLMAGLLASSDRNAVFGSSIQVSAKDYGAMYRNSTGREPDGLLGFQIAAFSKEATMLIADWVRSGCAIPSETFVEYFLSMVPRELYRALDCPDLPADEDSAVFLLM